MTPSSTATPRPRELDEQQLRKEESHAHIPTPTAVASSLLAATAGGKPIDEPAFLSDLLFLWMGVERTNYFRFNPETSRYEAVSAQHQGSCRQRMAFEQLQEAALLALEIEGMLHSGGSSGGEGLSFLQQSLRGAVQAHMTQYHYFAASLRERADTLTVADTVVAFKKVVSKLTLLSLILTETRNAKGGVLVSRMESLAEQGSQRLIRLVRDIHTQTVMPLIRMAAEWIVTGQAADPFQEFFIRVNPNVAVDKDQFWKSRFMMEPSMLPTTVPLDVATDILRVGRNIAMITQCCRAKDWQMDPAVTAAARTVSFATLADVVREALRVTDKAVMHLLMERYRLRDVLAVVQQFLLVGHGDFFEMLIRRLDPVLSKPSSAVQSAAVADHVEAALLECTTTSSYGVNGGGVRSTGRTISARTLNAPTASAGHQEHEPHGRRDASALPQLSDLSDIVGQLQSEVSKIDQYTGWECFSLTLPLPTPLNNIFDSEALRVYRRLFKLLFSVKRAEVNLKQSWRQSVVLDRLLARLSVKSCVPLSGGGGRGVPASVHTAAPIPDAELTIWRKVAGDAHLLGLQFNHFVTNLWSYFVAEVSTTAWDKLNRATDACTSVDELRQVHTVYLQHLMMHSLLHTDCRDARELILEILSLVRSLCAVQVQLTNFLERGTGDIVSVSGKYQTIADDFERRVTALLRLLEEQHTQYDFLNFLLLRLNFNQFYRDTTNGANTEF
jgi:gamma-tubulin complex component 3